MAIGRRRNIVALGVLVLAVVFLAKESIMVQQQSGRLHQNNLGLLMESLASVTNSSSASSSSSSSPILNDSRTNGSIGQLRGFVAVETDESSETLLSNETTVFNATTNPAAGESVNSTPDDATHNDDDRPPPSDFFSACMLTMDDNHFLTEWLAYHYHTLPLRHFIVAVDPNSKTSPSKLFDKWRAHGMIIEEWSDEDFIPSEFLAWTKQPNQTEQEKVDVYITRQNTFMSKCLLALKATNRTWALLADSDEYLVLNQHKTTATSTDDGDDDKQQQSTAPTIDQPSSVMTFLQQQQHHDTNSSSSSPVCVMIPRLRFGTKESSPKNSARRRQQQQQHAALNTSAFLTLRFRKHANRDDRTMNKISKAMVDVSRISESDMVVENLHRPIKAVCPKEHLRIRIADSFYVLHHYLGAWEQFNFRNDVRKGEGRARNPKAYNTFKDVDDKDSDDDYIQPWLDGFVNDMGEEKAKGLLEGVGVVG